MLKCLLKPISYLIISLFWISMGHAQETPPHIILGKKLTPFWSKEYTGLDLANDIIEHDKIMNSKKELVPFAVFDLGFEKDHITLSEGFLDIPVRPQMNGRRTMRAHHGTSVLNLLTGPENLRMTNSGSLIGLGSIQFSGQYNYAFKKMEERGTWPKIVSNSLGWNTEKIPQLVEEVEKKGTLWLLAAGNSFPDPVKKIERDSRALLIGSFAPNGMTSYEAQIHQSMVVLAPANKELLTINGYGKIHSFGASSGATPVAAATLINMSFYLPELTRKQAITILRKTAWPSAENKIGYEKLPPLLNSYKAILLARYLSLECNEDARCIDEVLNGNLDNVLLDAGFEWTSQEKNLRSSSLLGNENSRKSLIEFYQNKDFYWNAEFFKFVGRSKLDFKKLEGWTEEAIQQGTYEFNSYRYFPLYSEKMRTFLKETSFVKEHHKGIYLGLNEEDLKGRP
jgi:hypothetical protein